MCSRSSLFDAPWLVALIGIGAFHLGLAVPALRGLVVLTCAGAFVLGSRLSPRRALASGWCYGFALFAPQLHWMAGIFGVFAVVLWLVLSFWVGLFTNLLALSRGYVASRWWLALIAGLAWCGMEYARCELNWLRFSWFSTGFVLGPHPLLPLLGYYGSGCAAMVVAAMAWNLPAVWRGVVVAACCLVVAGSPTVAPTGSVGPPPVGPQVVGVQLEFPSRTELLHHLDAAYAAHPTVELLLLSEYTFHSAVPEVVARWADEHDVYLLVGGVDRVSDSESYNTAFVYGPDGQLVFKQAKAQPIQFFADGLPAPSQRCWDSPWGRIGIAVCYDLSYTCFIDELVSQGARALIIPTMDVESWGAGEHHQHARIAPLRAREYGLPIVRICSSGISQVVDAGGAVVASAPFPGPGERISHSLHLASPGRVPPFRRVAMVLGYAFMIALGGLWVLRRKFPRRCDRNA